MRVNQFLSEGGVRLEVDRYVVCVSFSDTPATNGIKTSLHLFFLSSLLGADLIKPSLGICRFEVLS